MILKVICEICFETIGIIDSEKIFKPMTGDQFQSADPFHGLEPPFPSNALWYDMKCPYGNHRPFIEENRVKTERGYRSFKEPPPPPKPKVRKPTKKVIDKPKNPIYVCNICGRKFWSAAALGGHRRSHK